MTEFAIADVEGVSVNKSMTVFAAPDQTNRVRVTMGSVVEMLLKDRNQLNLLLRDENHQGDLVPILLAVAVVGFVTYGVAATAIINGLYQASGFWLPHLPAAHWNSPSAANLTLGYALGLIAANGICLPSFYFYGLLAGVKISMVGISAHALKGMAAGAVALVGLLPIYVAVALSAIVFPLGNYWAAHIVVLGLALPFIAGLVGVANLYEGFVTLADTLPGRQQCSRVCFLRRLTLAWCTCATFVTPVVIYSLWDFLSDLTA